MKREILEWAIYFVLLGLSYIFIDQTYQEYVEGRTNYITSSHTLSTDDHPTVSVCFDHTENLFIEDMTFITMVANATVSMHEHNKNNQIVRMDILVLIHDWPLDRIYSEQRFSNKGKKPFQHFPFQREVGAD